MHQHVRALRAGDKAGEPPPGETEKKKPQPLPPIAVNPTLPVKPANRTLPVKPAEPTLPIKPAQQTLPPQPAQQTLPVQPAEPRIAKAEPQPAPAPAPAPASQQHAKREEPKSPPVRPECRKESRNVYVDESESTTVPMTIIGGAKCTHRITSGPDVQLTEASIVAEPSNGTLTQTDDFTFEYEPEQGFKGSDEYTVQVCGETNRGSGCSTVTYEVTVQ